MAVPTSLRPHTVAPLDLDIINSDSPFRGHGGATSSLLKPKAKRVLPTKSAAAAARQRAASALGGGVAGAEQAGEVDGDAGAAHDAIASKLDMSASLEYEGSLAPYVNLFLLYIYVTLLRYRSTRLAENYVTSVSQQSMIRQLEKKFASLAFPLPPLPPSFNSQASPQYVEQDVPIPSLPEAARVVQSSLIGAIDPTQSAFSVSALQAEEARQQPVYRPRPVVAAATAGAAFRSASPSHAGGGGSRHVPDNFPPIPTRHQVRARLMRARLFVSARLLERVATALVDATDA